MVGVPVSAGAAAGRPAISIRSSTPPDRADPPLRVRVRPWRPHRRAHHPDPIGGEDRVERDGELAVPIADQEPEPAGPVSRSMRRLRACWVAHAPRVGGDPEQVDAAGGDLDHEQHVQPLEDTVSTVKKSMPARSWPGCGGTAARFAPTAWVPGGRRAAAGSPDRAGPDTVAEPTQFAVDPAVAPGRVLPASRSIRRADLAATRGPAAGVGRSSGGGPDRDASAAASRPDEQAVPATAEAAAGRARRGRHGQPSPAGVGDWRRRTATSWRSTRISTSLAAERRDSSTSHPSSRQKIRYSSRSAIHRSSRVQRLPPAKSRSGAYGRLSGTLRAGVLGRDGSSSIPPPMTWPRRIGAVICKQC